MFCVMAPPQKKLNGATVILLLSLKGAVFDPISVDSGACVLVNPKVAIAEIGGTRSWSYPRAAGAGWTSSSPAAEVYFPSL